MTSAHIAPHVENLGNTISQFHSHIESGHEAPHDASVPIVQPFQIPGIVDAANNAALHFLQLAARVKKSFPEAERHHFYVDLQKEVTEAAHKAGQSFNELKPTLVSKGINCSDIVMAMEGAMIAIIAMFDILKAADPKYEEHCAHIEASLMGTVQGAIDRYSKP
ncbi:hypothetical protein FIBSPDRAFT_886111 [Athelia psychrophila]|uniref:Uncharacterized protein n=1 Tax=Athelia psychrophila TaxID=1759441 RepID=A0A166R402_9AGAM|nr:hypothetical protein FIBSPDRAFT_886111 [Fibularhizoctonia sp. CBS 109695]